MIMNEIKRALKAFLENYLNAMTMYGEAINKSRGLATA